MGSSAGLPVVSEDVESKVKSSSRPYPVLCEDTARVCVMWEDASSNSGVHGIVELWLSKAAVSGQAVAVPLTVDTGTQYNVVSCPVLKRLQLEFPDIDIVRPDYFSVGIPNQTTAQELGLTMAEYVMITSGADEPLRLGGIKFVVVDGTSDLLLLGHSTLIEDPGIDAAAILSSITSSDIPAAPWVKLTEINQTQLKVLIHSMQRMGISLNVMDLLLC